jgi:hypothetical protein
MITETRAAILTGKFVATPNVVPAVSALYGSVDQLKHLKLFL